MKPSTEDLILLEMRDLLASVGEIRLAVGALMERVERLENRCACDDAEMRKTVTPTYWTEEIVMPCTRYVVAVGGEIVEEGTL